MDIKERRRAKAIERSRKANQKPKKIEKTEDDLKRLERFKRRQIIFRKFSL